MKTFLVTILAVLLISVGTNASNSLKADHRITAENAAIITKLHRSCFTSYTFYSHYDSTTNETWYIVGITQDGMDTFVVTTAYYISGGTPVYASYVGTYISGAILVKDHWYWTNSPTNTTVHVSCNVHYNQSDLGYFVVNEDMVTAVE